MICRVESGTADAMRIYITNLLMNDFGKKPVVSETCNDVMKIQREFTKLKLERAVENMGGKHVELTCATRLCSNRDCILNFVHNLPYYQAVKEDAHTIENEVSLMLEDEFSPVSTMP